MDCAVLAVTPDASASQARKFRFVWDKHEQKIFEQARELLDEAAKGEGPRLAQIYKKLEKKDHSLRVEDLAQTLASGDQDEAFCGKKLFKEGDIQKWATRELKLR